MNIALVGQLETTVDNLLRQYVNQVSANLSGLLAGVAVAGLTLYYLTVGLAIARGEVSEPLSRLTKDALGQLLVCLLALGGLYQHGVVAFINDLQGDLISAVTTRDVRTVGALLDLPLAGPSIVVDGETRNGLIVLYEAAINDRSTLGIPNLSYLIGSAFAFLGFMFVAVFCLVPTLLAKVGLAIMLAIGPVFVLTLLWPPTRQYFGAWLSATLGFVLTSFLVAVVCSLVPKAFLAALAQGLRGSGQGTYNPVSMGLSLLIIGFTLGLTALHVSAKGAHLAGGAIAMDSKGVIGMVLERVISKFPAAGAALQGLSSKGSPGGGGRNLGLASGAGGALARMNNIIAGLKHRNR